MTEKDKIIEHTGETGNASKTELGQVLSKTPLTMEEKIDEIGKTMTNINAGISEVINLSKDVFKKQGNTTEMIESQITKLDKNITTTEKIHQEVEVIRKEAIIMTKEMGVMTEQIGTITKQIDTIKETIQSMKPSKDEIFYDIFSGKDGGEIEYIDPNSNYIQKGGIYERIPATSPQKEFKYNPDYCNSIESTSKSNLQTLMLYCIRIILYFKSKGISIENSKGLDIQGNEIFCTTQGFSWTLEEIKKGIKDYCPREGNKIDDILIYIMYLYKKYN